MVMTEIQEKFNDTALQISHQSFTHLDIRTKSSQSFLSTTAKDRHPSSSVTMLPDSGNRNYSVSDSMFSSGGHTNSQSAELNSLGNEEYNDEPSRMSWRRQRRSDESFI
jgi:hypothetical protein